MRRFQAPLLALALSACAAQPPDESPSTDTETATAPREGWLVRHRSADGGWDPDPAAHRCGCLDGEGSSPLGRAGATGLATLAFLEQGETHRTPRYGHVVRDALRYLKGVQDADGCFSRLAGPDRTLDHAIAAVAMSEAYALTQSPLFRDSARRGVRFALSLRGPEGAWGRMGGGGPPDPETTAWMAMAIRAGGDPEESAGREALDRVRAWVDGGGAPDGSPPGIALLIHHLAGAERGDAAVVRGRALALGAVPRWGGPGPEPDLATAYLGSVAMFATSVGRPFPSGDPCWEPWYSGLRTLRWPEIAPDDCAAGSFGRGPGRLPDTALAYLIDAFGYR